MNAYELTAWGSFFVAEVGAAAALTGLLFVAVSINLARILQFPKLPARAAETLALLLLVLVVASLGLVPQSAEAFGVEVLLCAGLTTATSLSVQLRAGPDSSDAPASWYLSRIIATQVPAVAFVIGSLSVFAGWGGGLFWMVPATLLAFVGAIYNAWILLVEIVRQNPTH